MIKLVSIDTSTSIKMSSELCDFESVSDSFEIRESTKPFVIHDRTKIGFGKLRGKPHMALLERGNRQYAEWILSQGEDFKYSDTRTYILNNISNDIIHDLTFPKYMSLKRKKTLSDIERRQVKEFEAEIRNWSE